MGAREEFTAVTDQEESEEKCGESSDCERGGEVCEGSEDGSEVAGDDQSVRVFRRVERLAVTGHFQVLLWEDIRMNGEADRAGVFEGTRNVNRP